MVKASRILEELESCKKPLFLFDDDADGLCSFLQMYGYIKEGNGVVVKTNPLDTKLLRKVEEYNPDKVFILDVASVEDEFLDRLNVPVVWIDHHPNEKRNKVIHMNPHLGDGEQRPTSQLCYEVTKDNLWVAMIGITADWVYDDKLAKKFRKDFPELLSEDIKTPEAALFESTLGELAKIYNFLLKGNNKSVKKNINVLTRIKSPYEILKQETPQGKYLFKKYKQESEPYDNLLKEAMSNKSDDKILMYILRKLTCFCVGER